MSRYSVILKGWKPHTATEGMKLRERLVAKLGFSHAELESVFKSIPSVLKVGLTKSEAHDLMQALISFNAVAEIAHSEEVNDSLKPTDSAIAINLDSFWESPSKSSDSTVLAWKEEEAPDELVIPIDEDDLELKLPDLELPDAEAGRHGAVPDELSEPKDAAHQESERLPFGGSDDLQLANEPLFDDVFSSRPDRPEPLRPERPEPLRSTPHSAEPLPDDFSDTPQPAFGGTPAAQDDESEDAQSSSQAVDESRKRQQLADALQRLKAKSAKLQAESETIEVDSQPAAETSSAPEEEPHAAAGGLVLEGPPAEDLQPIAGGLSLDDAPAEPASAGGLSLESGLSIDKSNDAGEEPQEASEDEEELVSRAFKKPAGPQEANEPEQPHVLEGLAELQPGPSRAERRRRAGRRPKPEKKARPKIEVSHLDTAKFISLKERSQDAAQKAEQEIIEQQRKAAEEQLGSTDLPEEPQTVTGPPEVDDAEMFEGPEQAQPDLDAPAPTENPQAHVEVEPSEPVEDELEGPPTIETSEPQAQADREGFEPAFDAAHTQPEDDVPEQVIEAAHVQPEGDISEREIEEAHVQPEDDIPEQEIEAENVQPEDDVSDPVMERVESADPQEPIEVQENEAAKELEMQAEQDPAFAEEINSNPEPEEDEEPTIEAENGYEQTKNIQPHSPAEALQTSPEAEHLEQDEEAEALETHTVEQPAPPSLKPAPRGLSAILHDKRAIAAAAACILLLLVAGVVSMRTAPAPAPELDTGAARVAVATLQKKSQPASPKEEAVNATLGQTWSAEVSGEGKRRQLRVVTFGDLIAKIDFRLEFDEPSSIAILDTSLADSGYKLLSISAEGVNSSKFVDRTLPQSQEVIRMLVAETLAQATVAKDGETTTFNAKFKLVLERTGTKALRGAWRIATEDAPEIESSEGLKIQQGAENEFELAVRDSLELPLEG